MRERASERCATRGTLTSHGRRTDAAWIVFPGVHSRYRYPLSRSDRSWNADRRLDRRCKIPRVARRESQLCPPSLAARRRELNVKAQTRSVRRGNAVLVTLKSSRWQFSGRHYAFTTRILIHYCIMYDRERKKEREISSYRIFYPTHIFYIFIIKKYTYIHIYNKIT